MRAYPCLLLILAGVCHGWYTADKWRLSPGPRAGRLEVRYSGHWGTTCDDSFDSRDARVACRKLGLPTTHARVTSAYGPGSGPIWLDDLHCSGYESSIDDCSGNSWGSHDCDHSEDIGVVCSSHAPAKWRLQPGPRLGTLEAFYNGQWRAVCSRTLTDTDAKVACKKLGLPYGAARTLSRANGRGTGSVWMNEPACTGVESSLDDCPGHRWGTYDCSQTQTAGILCSDGQMDEVIQTRLEPGPDEGKVKVFYKKQWRSVCDKTFSLNEARLVCKSLGYEANYAQVLKTTRNGPIHGTNQMISSLVCRSNVKSVEQCQFSTISTNRNPCLNGGEATVKCSQDPPLRLVPGPTKGRLEVYWDGEWGTVCNDNFTLNAAKVACNVLGLESDNAKILGTSQVGKGSGRILLDDVTCRGDESSFPCTHRGWGVHNCGHEEDVGVDCSTNAPVRLVPNFGGSIISLKENAGAGRLEVFHNGQWGTVCSDHFGYEEGRVVCRQLGYNPDYATTDRTPLSPAGRMIYDAGKGEIWMDDVNCTGTESYLDECQHRGWGAHNCHHLEDVGIFCQPALPVGIHDSGLAIVIWKDEPGTICSDNFSYEEAKVMCRSTGGLGDFAEVIPSTSVGKPGKPIWLDDVDCTGSEKSLGDCQHRGMGVHNCQHSQDVSVSCPKGFRIRLNPGPERGLLEVFRNGTWGTVCGSFSVDAAKVVCREKGLETDNAEVVRQGSYTTTGTIKDIRCTGRESALNKCRFTWNYHTHCSQRPVQVSCPPNQVEGGVKTRLVPGRDEGRLEVFYKNQWRTVCDKNFTFNEAKTVCKSLGYEAKYAQVIETTGRGTINRYKPMVSSLVCRNNVDSIEQCRFSIRPMNQHPCQDGGEATVKCSQDPPLRLVPGPTKGRLEVYWDGEWGTVCNDNFTSNAAKVVCNFLGLQSKYAVKLHSSKYKKGSGRILLDDVTCRGDESSFPCTHRGWGVHNCEHEEDVGVDCASRAPVRLVPKISLLSLWGGGVLGRLEVFHDGQWGTVCSNHFTHDDARVVCRQLGYNPDYTTTVFSPLTDGGRKFYEPGKGEIWMDDVNCTGTEDYLDECQHRGWGSHDCIHLEDVGIICRKDLAVSLLPSGLVVVQWKGKPGTICSDNFSYEDARVVCRSKNLLPDFAEVIHSTSVGKPDIVIWLDDLGCTGSEKSLVDCPHRGWGVHNCQHSQDVSVSCPKGFRIRLNPGPERGLLEVFRNGTWGTVCGSFSVDAARVVCREKGLETETPEVVREGSSLTQGTITDIRCNGTESALNQCQFTWRLHPHCYQGPVRVTCQPRFGLK